MRTIQDENLTFSLTDSGKVFNTDNKWAPFVAPSLSRNSVAATN